MKKLFFLAAAFTAALFVSCNEEMIPIAATEEAVVSDAEFPDVIYATKGEPTKSNVERYDDGGVNKYRHHWEDEDVLYVFSSTTKTIYTCTDAATGEFTKGDSETISYNFPSNISGEKYFAAYSSVGDIDVTGNSIVSVLNTPGYTSRSAAPGFGDFMVGASKDGTSFKMTSQIGWVKLVLSGNKTVETVSMRKYGAGEDYEGTYRYNFNTSSYNFDPSQGESIDVYLATPVTLSESSPTEFYIALPPMTYAGMNFEIKFSDGQGSFYKSTSNTVRIDANTVTPMQSLVSSPHDLTPTSAYANCYMVSNNAVNSLNRRFKFRTCKVDGTAITGGVSAKVLWETRNGIKYSDPAISEGDVVSDVEYAGGYISFNLNGKGNALIALYDGPAGTGNILWSWHIWSRNVSAAAVMNREISWADVSPGLVLMEQDLGYVDGAIYALSYQWGRKDPFYPSNFEATVDLFTYSSNLSASVATSVKNPMSFYADTYWNSERDLTLWGSTKTNYDPCPPGWKVPEETAFMQLVGYNVISGPTKYLNQYGLSLYKMASTLGSGGSNGRYYHTGAYTEYGQYRIRALNTSTTPYEEEVVPIMTANPIRCQKQ